MMNVFPGKFQFQKRLRPRTQFKLKRTKVRIRARNSLDLRMIFMGSSNYGLAALNTMVQYTEEIGGEILGVFTEPKKAPKIYGEIQERSLPPVLQRANELNLCAFHPTNLDAVLEGKGSEEDQRAGMFLRESTPIDLMVASAYGYILPTQLRALARLGCVTLHPSFLPAYRGGAPIHWAIANGERWTGVSTLLMDEGLDTGPILFQDKVDIGPNEDTPHLRRKLIELGSHVLWKTLEGLAKGTITPKPQPQTGVSLAPKVREMDGQLDWRWSAEKIRNRIRAMRPWPGTQTIFQGRVLKISNAHLLDWIQVATGSLEPGTIHHMDEEAGLFISTGDDRSLLVSQIQIPGQGVMKRRDLFRELGMQVGHRFENFTETVKE